MNLTTVELTDSESDLILELLNARRLEMLRQAIESKDELYASEAKRCKRLMQKISPRLAI